MKTLPTCLLAILLAACAQARAGAPECVVPSKPGGAMDLTCKLAQANPEFPRMRAAAGLHPFSLTGDALTRYVKKAVLDYNRQARQFNLVR